MRKVIKFVGDSKTMKILAEGFLFLLGSWIVIENGGLLLWMGIMVLIVDGSIILSRQHIVIMRGDDDE